MPALVRLDHSFVPSIRGVRGKTMDATRLQSNKLQEYWKDRNNIIS